MDIKKEREAFEIYYIANHHDGDIHPNQQLLEWSEKGEFYFATSVNDLWDMWLAAKQQAIPDGFVVVPNEPTYEMWSELSRHLGRYMQTHDRYCPKTLKKYFDRFIGDPPEWLSKEVGNWDSDHAFATADLPVFIYKAMIQESQK